MKKGNSIKSIGFLPMRIKQKVKRRRSSAVEVYASAGGGVHWRIMWYTYVVRNEKHPIEGWRVDSRLVSFTNDPTQNQNIK